MIDRQIKKRIVVSVCLFLSLFLLPWWLTSFFAIVFLLKFDSPYEVLAIGFFIDYLYRILSGNFLSDNVFFLSSCLLFLLSYFLKEHITFSRKGIN